MILKAVSGQPVADESGADADQLATAGRKRSRGPEPGAPAGRTDGTLLAVGHPRLPDEIGPVPFQKEIQLGNRS